jgi:adenylate cyclase
MTHAVERRGVAVLYARLRNFAPLSEILDPAKVIERANEFFALLARSATENNGQVLAGHNDALLGIFSAAADAVAAAKAAQREFLPLGERWQDEYGVPVALALGVHMGEAVLGEAGPAGARQPVAFGDCVNIAERLVLRARAGEIVLSRELVEALGVEAQTLGAEPLPPLALGRRAPLPIYGLLLETRLDFTGPMQKIG